jgi:sulfur-oxidizing protein SoxX
MLHVPSVAIAQELAPLTSAPGDPVRGMQLAIDSEKGNCIICHAIPGAAIPAGASGDIAPTLAGVGSRYSAGELRQRIANPKEANAETIMPAYFVTEGLYRVQSRYAGLPILTAQEIEDVVAYLETLQ